MSFGVGLSGVSSDTLLPTGVKIILLHELKNDEGIRLFLQETWELYVKASIFFRLEDS